MAHGICHAPFFRHDSPLSDDTCIVLLKSRILHVTIVIEEAIKMGEWIWGVAGIVIVAGPLFYLAWHFRDRDKSKS